MNNELKTIFIHIAAYRDPELIPTINNALCRAKYPERLNFGICLQDTVNNYYKFPYLKDKRFRIIFVDYKKSKGCCWARSKADSLYKGENYILQLDSHHRFVQNWDIMLINYLHKCPSKKPILSTYVNAYIPGGLNDKIITDKYPCRMVCNKFEDGLVQFKPSYVLKSDLLDDKPQPTMFISGHFIFTFGLWKKEVPYDPQIYFTGEEHTLAVRSFTNGWDIYYPPIPIICHMYTRQGRAKQWDDDKDWWKIDKISKSRVHNILVHNTDYGIYGLGKVRSLKDYQILSGIDYKNHTLKQHALVGIPNYKFKLYKTARSTFHTHDFKIWYEHNITGKVYKFEIILNEPNKITLRDTKRQIDVNLEDPICKWKESKSKIWKILDSGIFIF